MPVTFETIATNRQLVEHLADLSDVQLGAGTSEPAIYTVEGMGDIQVIGRDSTGGQFALSKASGQAFSGQVFYFSSEGEAGVLAKDFATFLAVVVGLPFWRDVLKFSGGGKIAEMRRVTELLEFDAFEDEEIATSRDQLSELLELDEGIDVVAALHTAVSSRVVIHDPWGNLAQPLFGSFKIEDNPMWRSAAG